MVENFPTDENGNRLISLSYGKSAPMTKDWPEDCYVQGGADGVVLVRKGDNYRTAFVEAFPILPGGVGTFIRGEGKTITEAEESCWAKYQSYLVCPSPSGDHEFETRGYTNGAGFCKHCNLFKSKAFSLKSIGSICFLCGEDYYGKIGDRMYCKSHQVPSYADVTDWVRENEAELPFWLAGFIDDREVFAELEFDEKYSLVNDALNHLLDLFEVAKNEGKLDEVVANLNAIIPPGYMWLSE